MGILILLVFAIGAGTIIYYVGKGAFGSYRKAFGLPKSVEPMQNKGLAAQDGSGETGWFGLPKYSDVIVPEKYNYYATVVYMDSPVKQYFYDLMAGWKYAASYTATEGRLKVWGAFLFFPILAALAGVSLNLIFDVVTVVVLLFVLWGFPSSTKTRRAYAEIGKDFTAADIRQVNRDLAESRERVDEMTTAFRRSGIGHRW
jgi:hypothetical protein